MASEVILTEAPSMLVAIIFYPARSSIIFLLFLAFFGLCFWPLFLAYNTLVALCLAFGLYYFSSLVCMGMMLRTQGFVVYWALHNSVMSLVGIVLLLTMAVITKFCPKNRDVLFFVLIEWNLIWNRINSKVLFANEKSCFGCHFIRDVPINSKFLDFYNKHEDEKWFVTNQSV